MTGPFYGCDNGGCSEECTYPAEYLRVYEGKLWCEGCWDNGQTIWLDGDGGDSGGNYLHYYDLDEFIPPEQQRIAELEADLLTARKALFVTASERQDFEKENQRLRDALNAVAHDAEDNEIVRMAVNALVRGGENG